MEFRIERKRLLEALSGVSKAISSRPLISILSGIRFILKDGTLTLTGSDSNITIQIAIRDDNLDIIREGSVVLTSGIILDIIKKIDSDTVHFSSIDNTQTIRITGGHSKFQIKGSDSREYPRIDLSKTGILLNMNAESFNSIVSQTAFAVSNKETRPILTGINFRCSDGKLECIACDSYRLAKTIIETADNDVRFNVTIPKKSIIEIARIFRDGIISMYVSERKAMFIKDDIIIQTRLIDGTYPDTGRLIPHEFHTVMKVDNIRLNDSIERTSLLSDNDHHIITLNIEENNIMLASSRQIIGSAEERLEDVTFIGKPLKISFDAVYLKEALRGLKGNNIKISFVDATRPFILEDEDNENVLQLMMGVRTF